MAARLLLGARLNVAAWLGLAASLQPESAFLCVRASLLPHQASESTQSEDELDTSVGITLSHPVSYIESESRANFGRKWNELGGRLLLLV